MHRTLPIAVVLYFALASFVVAQDKAPRYHPRFQEGVALMRQGQWAQAKELWEDVLQAKPHHYEARNNYAVSLIKLGGKTNLRNAEAILNDIIQALPNKGGARLNLGVAKVGMSQLRPPGATLDAALKDTDGAIAKQRERPTPSPYHVAEALYNRGWISDEQDKLAEAEKSYREAVQLRPDYAKAWLALAITLGKQRKYDDARSALVEAGRHHRNDPVLKGLIEKNGETLIELEKELPPPPPYTAPSPPTSSPPQVSSERTFWRDGLMGVTGFWDSTKAASISIFIGVYLFAFVFALGITEHVLGKYPRPNERKAAGWLTFFAFAAIFGITWGFAPWYKWIGILLIGGICGGVAGSKK